MNIKTILCAFICLLISSSISYSQITTGSIKMEVKTFDMPGMEGQDGAGVNDMIKNMSMQIHFKPGYQVTEMKMMGMIDMKMFYTENVSTQYMDMMGQKIKVVTPTNEVALSRFGLDADKLKEMYKVDYNKDETKDIMGYTCYKATMTMDLDEFLKEEEDVPAQLQNMEMEMYLTEDIKMDNYNFQNIPGLNLKGVPLQFSINMGPMNLVYEATEVLSTLDESNFEKPEGDYKEMSIEDFQKMTGGFGGQK